VQDKLSEYVNRSTELKHLQKLKVEVDQILIHREIANKMQHCIKIYYSIFIWSSTCFGQHTAHHQELKTALAASGFVYVEGCWTTTSNHHAVSLDSGR